MLWIFFKYNRRLLGSLYRSALRSLTRYFEVLTGSELMPGLMAAIQTFVDRINIHPHLHFLVAEGGVDEAAVFHKIPRIDDSRLAELFCRVALADLVGRVYPLLVKGGTDFELFRKGRRGTPRYQGGRCCGIGRAESLWTSRDAFRYLGPIP
jgi:hypothetical protein